jgi:hypothetical protein
MAWLQLASMIVEPIPAPRRVLPENAVPKYNVLSIWKVQAGKRTT